MALANEGKTMEKTSITCDSCKMKASKKFCEDCNIGLCSSCTDIHRNIPATKHHTISDISASTKPRTCVTGKCHRHNNNAFTIMCKDCVLLICDACKTDHVGHDIQTLTNDAQLYQKVCSKNIQRLLDDLQEVEGVNNILERHVNVYDEAKSIVDKWELELLQMVKAKAMKLRQEITQLRDDKQRQLTDRTNGLIANLQEIDSSITNLNAIRKSIDCQMLSTEISNSQALLDKLKVYKTELQSIPPSVDVQNVLPHGEQIKTVEDDLNVLLSLEEIGTNVHYKGPQPVAEWRFNVSNRGKDLSVYSENEVKMTGISFGPGPNGEPEGSAILPTSLNQSMIVMNPTDKLRFKTEMTLYAHIFIDGTKTGTIIEYQRGKHALGTYIMAWPDTTTLRLWNAGIDEGIPNVLMAQRWLKLTVVYGPTHIKVYMNGKHKHTLYGSVNLSGTQHGGLHFGCRPGTDYNLQGRLASVKFFDCALSEADIKNLT